MTELFKPCDNKIITEEEKKKILDKLEKQFKGILETMLFDTDDPNLKETPKRIAKAWFLELLSGRYVEKPKITVFPNENNINQMVTLGNIEVKSMCSHHFLPFFGKCFIGYVPDKIIIGISKLARIVKWFARRAQLQEVLTKQIADFIYETIKPKGVIVYMSCIHTCMTLRGANQPLDTKLVTTDVRGCMEDENAKTEFLKYIGEIR